MTMSAASTVLFSLWVAASAAAQCIDYGDHAHLAGGVATGGSVSGVAVMGHHAYVVDSLARLVVIDIAEPTDPRIVQYVPLADEPRKVVGSGGRVYVIDGAINVKIFDVAEPETPVYIGRFATGSAANLALVGTTLYLLDAWRLKVVDVSDPAEPRELASVETPVRGSCIAAAGSRVYFAGYGDDSVYVVDASDPSAPRIAGEVYDFDFNVCGLAAAGDIVYAASQEGSGDPLFVVDASDPTNPRIMGSAYTWFPGLAVAIDGDHAFVTRAEAGLAIVDVSDPSHPTLVGSVGTPGGLGWDVTVAGDHAYVADGARGLQVIDVANPVAPPLLGTLETSAPFHGVVVSGTTAYAASGSHGLQVIDVSDPTAPTVIGGVGAGDDAECIASCGERVALASTHWGGGFPYADIFLVDVTDPTHPQILGSVTTPGHAADLAMTEDYVLVAGDTTGLHVVEAADPHNPRLAHTVDTPGRATGVATGGDHAYVTDGDGGFHVLDIAAPEPHIVGTEASLPEALDVVVVGDLAYVVDGRAGLCVIDVADVSHPRCIGDLDRFRFADAIAVEGRFAYLAGGLTGLQVVDVTNPSNLRLVGCGATIHEEYVQSVACAGGVAYLAGLGGFYVAPRQCDEVQSVFLSSLDAARVGNDAVLRWSIDLPQDHIGFTVWRDMGTSGRILLGQAVAIDAVTFEFTDHDPPSGSTTYWLRETAPDGRENWYGPAQLPAGTVIAAPRLEPNEPNPFNPTTTWRYSAPSGGPVRLAVYDLRGALVKTLVDADLPAGEGTAVWDGRNDQGGVVPAGVYLVRLETSAGVRTAKATLAR